MSGAPPGVKPTTMCIGLAEAAAEADCANAVGAASSAPAHDTATTARVIADLIALSSHATHATFGNGIVRRARPPARRVFPEEASSMAARRSTL